MAKRPLDMAHDYRRESPKPNYKQLVEKLKHEPTREERRLNAADDEIERLRGALDGLLNCPHFVHVDCSCKDEAKAALEVKDG